jgi:hypothetical protein
VDILGYYIMKNFIVYQSPNVVRIETSRRLQWTLYVDGHLEDQEEDGRITLR